MAGNRSVLCYDLAAAVLSLSLALLLFDNFGNQDRHQPPPFWLMAVELTVALASALIITNVYRQVWRHTSASDVRRIVETALLANLIVLPVALAVHDVNDLPVSLILIEAPILISLMVGGRMTSRARATGQWLSAFRRTRGDYPYAIIVGNCSEVAETISALSQSEDGLPVRPLGIIATDTPNSENIFAGRAICGVQVLGNIDKLDHFISVLTMRFEKTPWIALVGRLSDRASMDQVLDVSSRHGATIQRLRRNGEVSVEPVRPNDLLHRPERRLSEHLVSELIANSRVLVTGAGGTIGSELVRQCAALGPAEITLYDSGEYNLYEIDLYLRQTYPNMGRRTYLGDVRDTVRLTEAMREARPDVVIHAAALKHVL